MGEMYIQRDILDSMYVEAGFLFLKDEIFKDIIICC